MVDAPKVVRIVVDGWTRQEGQQNNVDDARRMLNQSLQSTNWPRGVKFTITPGGFVCAPFSSHDIDGGWNSEKYFEQLTDFAGKAVNSLLSQEVKKKLKRQTQYLTVGVDLNNTGVKASSDIHAELVAIFDTAKDGIVHWTGKSYPVEKQARTLVQAPLKTHFFDAEGSIHTLVLGCHDIHMFTDRGRRSASGQTPKEARKSEMLDKAQEYCPSVVLHHPHTTYSHYVWGSAWGALRSKLPTTKTCVSGIAFCGNQGCPREWQTLEDVLERTGWGDITDVKVKGF